MDKHVVAVLPGGKEVYVNLISSPAGNYLRRLPYVLQLIKNVINLNKLTEEKITIVMDMGRVIGTTEIVVTSEKDTIIYAQSHKNAVFARYAKNRNLEPSDKLTMLLGRDDDGNYEIYDTWIGPFKPPFPGDENEISSSKTFWENHALVLNPKTIEARSITKTCPY